jgi:hypothetical protein
MKKILLFLAIFATAAVAQTVPANFFGMHFNSANTAWPVITSAPTPKWNGGVVRLHDSGVKLYDIFNSASSGGTCDPRAATPVVSGCNWTNLDKYAANALANNATLTYVFSKMPTNSYWSACFPYTSSVPTGTTCDDAFVSMVKAIRDRVGCSPTKQIGCVSQWEIWNEPNNNGGTHTSSNGSTPYWDGTIANLVHISRLVRDHVKTTAKGGVDGIDANALVIGPGGAIQTNVGSSGVSTTYSGTACDNTHTGGYGNGNLNVEAFTCLYLITAGSGSGDLTGKDYIDAVTAHLYPNSQTLSTLAEQPLTSRAVGMKTTMTLASISLCGHGVSPLSGGCKALIDTETSWGTCSSPTTPRLGPTGCSVQVTGTGQTGSWADDQAAALWKKYLLSWWYGLSGVYWYGWDFQNGYGNLLCTADNLTIGCDDATHSAYPYQQQAAKAWGAAQWMIGKTLTGCTTVNSTYSCFFSGPNGYSAVVPWNSGLIGVSTNYSNVTQTRDMYGNITPVTGGSVTLTPNYYPVVIETVPAVGSATPAFPITNKFADDHYEPKGSSSNAASAYVQKSANGSDFDDPPTTLANLGGQPVNYVEGGGTADAQTITLPTMPGDGVTVKWLPIAANTSTTPTLTINTTNVLTITKPNGLALTANDLLTTAIAVGIVHGSTLELQNPQATAGQGKAVRQVQPALDAPTVVADPAAGADSLVIPSAHWVHREAPGIPSYTVATLPASPAYDKLVWVTDAASSSSCATGGGSNKILCRWNGSSWDAAGGGGASSAAEIVALFSATPGAGTKFLSEDGTQHPYGLAHIDDGVTTAGVTTSTQPFQVNDGGLTRIDATKQTWGTPSPKGAYNGATAYVTNDVVTSGGVHYIAIASTTGNAPPNATYWAVLLPAGYDESIYIGGDNTMHCYLGSTQGSCAPSGLVCSAAALGALDDGTTDNRSILNTAQTACTGGIIFPQVTASGYKVASNLTFTVPVTMQGGYFVVPTGVTLTINGSFRAPDAKVFATSGTGAVKFGSATEETRCEWWDCKGDYVWGTGGTDDHVALQAAIDALTTGHLRLLGKNYSLGSSTLSITSHRIGIKGTARYWGRSVLLSTSASATIVSVAGSGGDQKYGNQLYDFQIIRAVAPTSSAIGLSLSHTNDIDVKRLNIKNNGQDLYVFDSPNGLIEDVLGQTADFTPTSTPTCGVCIDTTGGVHSNSLTFHRVTMSDLTASFSAHKKAFYVTGTSINDLFFNNVASATTDYGLYVAPSSCTGYACQDIHVNEFAFDGCNVSCVYVSGVSSSSSGSNVRFTGGWISGNALAHAVDIESSQAVSFTGTHATNGGVDIFYINAGSGNSLSNVTMSGNAKGIVLNATTNNSITNPIIKGKTSPSATTLIELNGSDRNIISAYTLYGTATTGILLDATSDNNTITGGSIDPTSITTPISNSGSGNGPGNVLLASLTTTAAASDNVTVTGMTSFGHCTLTPTNSSAATNIATTYVSAKTANQITVTHTATSGMTFDISCTQF